MKLIILFFLIVVAIFAGLLYYKRQNNTKQLGGPISPAKAIWLIFAIFQYYVMSAFLFLGYSENVFKHILGLVLLLFVIRGIFQCLWMFLFKKWKPYMGILFNMFAFVYIFKKIVDTVVFGPLLSMSTTEYVIYLYLTMFLFMLILDSYYAWKFSKIVGNSTTGNNAIWYASADNKAFKKINQTTAFFNVSLLAWFIVILAKLIALH